MQPKADYFVLGDKWPSRSRIRDLGGLAASEMAADFIEV